MTDEEIIELYFQRQESAIAWTARTYGSRLRHLAFAIVADASQAEECENDTYYQAWNAIPPQDPRGYFYAFLAKITRNLALNRYRREKSQKRGGVVVELSWELEACIPSRDTVETQWEEIQLKQTINGFLAELPLEKRNVFLRRYWFCDTIGDIAARYGLSQSKVKTMLHRMRTQLKNHLEQEGYSV